MDVKTEEYSLNGVLLGKTSADISKSGDLLIKPLNNALKEIRRIEQEETLKKGIPAEDVKAKFHIDESLSYDDFYKVVATLGFSGYTSIRYVIGSEYNNVYELYLPERNSNDTRNVLKLLTEMKEGKISDEKWAEWEQLQKERKKKYMNLSLSIDRKGDKFSYTIGFSKGGLTTFEQLDDLWRFIEDVRQRRELQDKEDKDKIILILQKNVLLKDVSPIIKKMTTFGYKLNFAYTN